FDREKGDGPLKARRRQASAGVFGAPLLLALGVRLRRCRQLEHGCALTDGKQRQHLHLATRELEKIVMTMEILLMKLAEDRDVVEGLRLVEWMLPSWFVERDLGPWEQANRHVAVGCIAEAGRAGSEITRFEFVTDLRRTGLHVLKAVVTHGPLPVLVECGARRPWSSSSKCYARPGSIDRPRA
ncbi:MAG: hypothetical protein WAL02_10300, partial [Rhodoplanes sp.]